MSVDAPAANAPLPAFSSVLVYGDSLVDSGNALKAAKVIDSFPFVSLLDAAPSDLEGYFQGRFTDGYNFADLISNKVLGQTPKATFPYGFEEPLFGLPVPFVNKPEGDSLSFAYGGARARAGLDPIPDLDKQTDIYRNFDSDPGALHIIAIGANDIREMVPTGGDPVVGAEAAQRLSDIANEIAQEVGQLYTRGARHVLVAGIPDVGLIPEYTGSVNEAARRALVSDYAERLDDLVDAALAALPLPAGAQLYDFDFIGLSDAVVSDPAAYGFTNVTQARKTVQGNALDPVGGGFLFFDRIHPSAQAHALIAGAILDSMRGAPPNGSLPPSIGAQAAGAIPVGGADSFIAALVAGRTYDLDILGITSGLGTLSDPVVRVLDGSGALLATDDDAGLGLDAHLRFVAPATGDYVVQVAGVGVTAGSYRLQAGEAEGPNLLLAGRLRGSDVAVQGGPANDTIAAEAGRNTLRGAEGNDSILGGSGFDDMTGNPGADTLVGGAGGDWVVGGKDTDLLVGGPGDDIVEGALGADFARGGQGDDLLRGGDGDDWLSGDRGGDTITGGAGADIFHIFAGAGLDRVEDFSAADGDRVELLAGTTYAVAQVEADTVVDLGGGTQMVLVGVTLTTLPPDWIFGA